MNPWMAILIFTLSVADDLLVVWYMRRVMAGRRGWAGLISGFLTGLISLEVVIYATEPIYVAPNCLGSVMGTYLAMWLENRLPRSKPRDKKGRFKPIPAIAQPKAEVIEGRL